MARDSTTLTAGPTVDVAEAIVVLLHGRGATAAGMLDLYQVMDVPWCAAIAVQAPGQSWYPNSFLAPLETNQPDLDRSLATIGAIVDDLIQHGASTSRIAFMGFSQGACLCAEFTARNPRSYGAVMALTGGLIGPPGTPRNYPGSLAGTRVFLGTSDPDPHVPFARVEETRDVFTKMGAMVELRRYAGMPHTINTEEINACRDLLHALRS